MANQFNAIFIRSAKKPGCNMVKVRLEGAEKDSWVKCTPAVVGFSAKTFQENQPVTIIGEGDGESFEANKIVSQGGYQQQSTQQPSNASNTASQASSTYTPPAQYNKAGKYRDPCTPEESERMCRLSVMSSVASAMVALTGQVDVNNISDIMLTTYDKCLAKIKS